MPANSLGNNGVPRGLALLLDVDEPAPLTGLAPELVPVVDMWSRPEMWALMGGSLGWGFASSPAVAGQLSHVQLTNPVGSGCLVIVEKCILSAGVVDLTYIAEVDTQITLGTSTSAWVNRDLRRAVATTGMGSLAGRIRYGSNAVSLVAAMLQLTFSRVLEVQLDVVLPPGWSLTWANTQANSVCDVNWFGREIAATPKILNRL